MTPLKAFKIVRCVSLHMKTMGFSILKFGTSAVALNKQYDKLTENQRFFFKWCSNHYQTEQDLIYATIACVFEGIDIRYAPKQEINEAFLKFKGRRESLQYYFNEDLSKWEDNPIPVRSLFFKYLVKEYTPEFVIVLSEYEGGTLDKMYEDPNMSFIQADVLKLIKYRDLFNYKKFTTIFKEKVTTSESHEHFA